MTTHASHASHALINRALQARAWLESLSYDVLALLARWSMALVFWTSGQTKVEGFALNPVTGDVLWGWPHISDSAITLFRDEYRLPWLPAEWAAVMAATAEHVLPLMLLWGLGTRLGALGLLGMTAVIQLLVYPGAYVTHATWATALLLVVSRGPGRWSLDHWLMHRTRR